MRWILYSILAASLAGGGLWAAAGTPQPASQEQTEPEEEELEDFVPSEKVPADSAISFPVDI